MLKTVRMSIVNKMSIVSKMSMKRKTKKIRKLKEQKVLRNLQNNQMKIKTARITRKWN